MYKGFRCSRASASLNKRFIPLLPLFRTFPLRQSVPRRPLQQAPGDRRKAAKRHRVRELTIHDAANKHKHNPKKSVPAPLVFMGGKGYNGTAKCGVAVVYGVCPPYTGGGMLRASRSCLRILFAPFLILYRVPRQKATSDFYKICGLSQKKPASF